MRQPKSFQTGLVLGLLNLVLAVSPSLAAPITYIEDATASGSLGGVGFTDADIVFSMTGDTNNATRLTSPSGSFVDSNFGTLTVSVAGGTPATFTEGPVVFHSDAGAIARVGFLTPDNLIIANSSVSASGYDLKTSIGPLSGPAQIEPGFPHPTTGGDFILTSVSSTATFTATTSGTVMGDPHFTTYDGLHYDFQAAGDFVLTRSTVPVNSFEVQIPTRPSSDGSAVTIVSAVATKLGDHRVTFDLDRAGAGGSFVWIDGHPISFQMHDSVLSLGAGRIIQLSPDHYQVIWNTGEILDVTNAGSLLNETVWLSPTDGPGSVEGLLGSDSGWRSDFQLADGTFLDPRISMSDLYGVFADTWRVTDAISLLNDVPEPNALTLLGIGLAGSRFVRRRTTSAKLRRSTSLD